MWIGGPNVVGLTTLMSASLVRVTLVSSDMSSFPARVLVFCSVLGSIAACGDSTNADTGPRFDGSPTSDSGLSDGGLAFDSRPEFDGGSAFDSGPEFDAGLPAITLTELKAFPTAVGFGRHASGGRGGRIIEVNNLNDSGEGSFRDACLASGPRIIVFRLGGTITLGSPIYVEDPDFTIAGETAPGDGIAVRGDLFQISVSNGIVRNIRFRVGNAQTAERDVVSITAWQETVVRDVIFDHCSLSWGIDEVLNIRGVETGVVRDVTVQDSIIGEGLRSHYGVLILGTQQQNITLFENFLPHNSERNIRASPGHSDGIFELVNNIVYGYRWGTSVGFGGVYDIVGNIFLEGATPISTQNIVEPTAAGQTTPSTTRAFVSGNIVPEGINEYAATLVPYLASSPNLNSGLSVQPASTLMTTLLPHVGASLVSRDAADARVVADAQNGTGGLLSNEDTVGGFPVLSDGTPYADANSDGIADSWAVEHEVSSWSEVKAVYVIDGHTIRNDAGYSAREIFFASLAGDFERMR